MSENNFPHPLNTWIEEEVDVPTFTPKVNEGEGRIEFEQTTKKVKQKTFYSDAKPRKVICSNHEYVPVGKKGNYKYQCIHCDWTRFALPVTYRYDPEKKKLYRRDTGVEA